MPGVIDPEMIGADNLPGIWSPVQWELSDEERIQEVENQATASLLWSLDEPEAILRMLLQETEIERLYEPPEEYDEEEQGKWDGELVTFGFRKPIELIKVEREHDYLYIEYKFGDTGYWYVEIEPEKVTIARI
ncbi:MAG TPA: hypothetical protein VLD65_07885 [Anaerolineales bacterium]|nr:hypothetical protein [Anaerolineales bacterium]